MAFIGALLFTAGSQAKYSDLRLICSRGGVLVVVRLLVAYIGSWLTIKFFGLDGFCGVSAMAITILLANCNPGVYMGLMQSYGDNVDKAAMGIINLIAVPATACLGASINMKAIANVGVAEVILIAIHIFIFLPIMIAADKIILRRPGYAAVAATCLGGFAVVAPRFIGESLPQYAPYVETVTAQMAVVR